MPRNASRKSTHRDGETKIRKPKDEVDQAIASAHIAIGKLVRLLGHEDPLIINRAIRALSDFGNAASEPLAVNLLRAETTRLRGAIMIVIRGVCTDPGPNVIEALLHVVQKDSDELMRTMAHATLSHFMDIDIDRELQRALDEENRAVKPSPK